MKLEQSGIKSSVQHKKKQADKLRIQRRGHYGLRQMPEGRLMRQ